MHYLCIYNNWYICPTARLLYLTNLTNSNEHQLGKVPFLPPANEVWGKVMFLHLSVIHSVYEGVCIRESWGRPLTPSDTTGHGQRAGGTHPTGMHYCFVQSNVRLRNIFNPDPLI